MEGLLNEHEAAEVIKFPEATLRYWRRTGYGPSWAKIGRRIYYRRTDIESWIDAQFETAASGGS